jgi:hypothetical protein
VLNAESGESLLKTAQAEDIAIAALTHLAADPDAGAAFLSASGVQPSDLRSRMQEPEFLGFVLDFVLSDDDLSRTICQSENLSPEQLHRARAALPGGPAPDWT